MLDNELPSSSKASLSSLQRDTERHQSVRKWDAAVKECQNVCVGLEIGGSFNALHGKKPAKHEKAFQIIIT